MTGFQILSNYIRYWSFSPETPVEMANYFHDVSGLTKSSTEPCVHILLQKQCWPFVSYRMTLAKQCSSIDTERTAWQLGQCQ